MHFVAVDVETANADYSSICQIGIAAYKDGRLSHEWKTYVDPEDDFSPINVAIHGIDQHTVEAAPRFCDISDQVSQFLDNRVVVCHTHFDRVAIGRGFHKYDLPGPQSTWLDTARVARRTWSEFAWSGYGLVNICNTIGYTYRCHDALEDAKAAAMVLLAAIAHTGLTVDEWVRRVEQPIDLRTAQPLAVRGNPDGPLFGNYLVFTGALEIPRKQAADMAAMIGCTTQTGVNRNTTMVVVGNQDIRRLAGHAKSLKHRRAEELIAGGQDIHILSERDFAELFRVSSGDVPQASHDAAPIRGTRAPRQTLNTSVVTQDRQLRSTAHEMAPPQTLSASELRRMMVELINQERRLEYLTLCQANYMEAVNVAMSLVPQFYVNTTDPFDDLQLESVKAKKAADTEAEIRILQAAIDAGTLTPGCYERLAILWSKLGDNEKAYQVCAKWFNSGRWKVPNCATTSLRLLDRIQKLEHKLRKA